MGYGWLLKLVAKGNNSDVMEVPELGSELCTWLRLVCCALAGTGESVEAPARDSGTHAKVIDNHDAAVYIQTHCL